MQCWQCFVYFPNRLIYQIDKNHQALIQLFQTAYKNVKYPIKKHNDNEP